MSDLCNFDPQLGYTLPYYVYHKDTDFREELRFTSFATCLQETAWAHARLLAVDIHSEGFSGCLWVLSRLHVEFTAPMPRWQDTLFIQTFPVGIEGIFAQRDFIAWSLPGGRNETRPGFPQELPCDLDQLKPFALVRTSWLIIDAVKRTLVRPQILKTNFAPHEGAPVFEPAPGKIKAPESWSENRNLGKVNYHAIDGLGHVNNVSYFEWALSGYDQAHHDEFALKRASANFNIETSWNHLVEARSSRLSGDEGRISDVHGVFHQGATNPAVILRFDWKEKT